MQSEWQEVAREDMGKRDALQFRISSQALILSRRGHPGSNFRTMAMRLQVPGYLQCSDGHPGTARV